MVSFSVAGVQALLEVVNDLFEEQTDLEKIVRKIMHRAQTLLKCERCSVQLLEDIESPVRRPPPHPPCCVCVYLSVLLCSAGKKQNTQVLYPSTILTLYLHFTRLFPLSASLNFYFTTF